MRIAELPMLTAEVLAHSQRGKIENDDPPSPRLWRTGEDEDNDEDERGPSGLVVKDTGRCQAGRLALGWRCLQSSLPGLGIAGIIVAS
ncbi:MAG: hypothetical protein JWR19_3105 [Pedosphaera sp.]|nr:hypothetical protein [Pedosphaera sp.]